MRVVEKSVILHFFILRPKTETYIKSNMSIITWTSAAASLQLLNKWMHQQFGFYTLLTAKEYKNQIVDASTYIIIVKKQQQMAKLL